MTGALVPVLVLGLLLVGVVIVVAVLSVFMLLVTVCLLPFFAAVVAIVRRVLRARAHTRDT